MIKINKKGFTLIELLAVLVVLAVVALITVPIVLKIINNATKQSAKSSIEGYAKAVENGLSNWQMLNPGKPYSSYDFSYINTKGNDVTCDHKQVWNNGDISLNCCYTSESKSKSEYFNYKNGKVTSSVSCDEISEQYALLDNVTVYGENYYVIGINNNYLTLVKKESIGSSKYYEGEECDDINDSIDNPSACNISYDQSTVKNVVNSWKSTKFKSGELVTVNGYSARLINETDFQSLGYNAAGGEYLPTNNKLIIKASWSMLSDDVGVVYVSQHTGSYTQSNFIFNTANVNPVINIKKEYVN